MLQISSSMIWTKVPDDFRENVFPHLDLDGTGVLNFIEYLASTLEFDIETHESILKGVFKLMDVEKTGWILVTEIS